MTELLPLSCVSERSPQVRSARTGIVGRWAVGCILRMCDSPRTAATPRRCPAAAGVRDDEEHDSGPLASDSAWLTGIAPVAAGADEGLSRSRGTVDG